MKKSPQLLIMLVLVLVFSGMILPSVCFASQESIQQAVDSQKTQSQSPSQVSAVSDQKAPAPDEKVMSMEKVNFQHNGYDVSKVTKLTKSKEDGYTVNKLRQISVGEIPQTAPVHSVVEVERLLIAREVTDTYKLELYVDKAFNDVDKVNIRISFQWLDERTADEWTLTYDMWSEYANFFKYNEKNQPVKDRKYGKNTYAYQKIDERVIVGGLMPGVPMRFQLTVDGANHDPIVSKIVEFVLPMPTFYLKLQVSKKDGSNNIYLEANVDTSPLPVAMWQAFYSYTAEVRTASGWTRHDESNVLIEKRHGGPENGMYVGPKFKMEFAVLACCPNAHYVITVKLKALSLLLEKYPVGDRLEDVPLQIESAKHRTFTDYLALDWAIMESIIRRADPYTGEIYAEPVTVFRGWVIFDYPDSDNNQLAYFQLCSSDDLLENGVERFSPCIPLLCDARKVNSRPDKKGRTFFEFEQGGLKDQVDEKGQAPPLIDDGIPRKYRPCIYYIKFFPKDKYGKAQCIHEKTEWNNMTIGNLEKEPYGDAWFNHLEN